MLGPQGTERHRLEGALPVDDFLAQLELGLARMAFEQNRFGEAERRYRQIVREFPNTDAAPEALYWAGASRYKETNDAAALSHTGAGSRNPRLPLSFPFSIS